LKESLNGLNDAKLDAEKELKELKLIHEDVLRNNVKVQEENKQVQQLVIKLESAEKVNVTISI
jgi:Ser/Thr protein kinase RdoA (MazF antagonist)